MKKLKLAIIGQGRSGKNIHGKFYLSERNKYFDVGYVVDADSAMRERVRDLYAGCTVLSDYTELFGHDDIDLVVNASYSDMHYPITKDLLEHGFNVLTESRLQRRISSAKRSSTRQRKTAKCLPCSRTRSTRRSISTR